MTVAAADPAPDRAFGSGGPTLADTGEVALLDRLVALSGGDGDDAAVWSPPPGQDLAWSVDALVEEVDFRRGWITPHALGRRAFAVAVSDLAAMGATPLRCTATLCAAPGEALADVLAIHAGLCAAAAAAGCAVAGGDVSATAGPLVLDVGVIGALPQGRALRRGAGRPGDLLAVTGTLGGAAAGLRVLLGEAADGSPARAWVAAQLEPPARLAEGRALLERGIACAGDVSDGLLLDALRTATASGCAAELWADALPVADGVRNHFGAGWLDVAVGGGEDFELLLAAEPSVMERVTAGWPGDLAPLTVVGALRSGSGVRILDREGGTEVAAPPSRAAHFQR